MYIVRNRPCVPRSVQYTFYNDAKCGKNYVMLNTVSLAKHFFKSQFNFVTSQIRI